jgi:predicted nucleic acid-binding protein
MITLDTSGLYALLNRKDSAHVRAKKVLQADRGPYVVPAGILAEICYLVEQRLGLRVLTALLRDLTTGFAVDCGDNDFDRIRALVERFADLPLGFADACVIACAERNGGRVLSFDRDIAIVAGKARITVVSGD